MLQQLTCSVVICTRNRTELLDQCLAALDRQVYRPLEIIVVDNAATDRRTERIAAQRGARYFHEPVIGLSRARNLGAAKSCGDIIAYIDDDALPNSDWLEHLVSGFQDLRTMAVGGRTVAPEEDEAVRRMCVLIQGPGSLMEPRVIDKSDPKHFEIATFGGIGMGMNMAFRRSIFDYWPGFDVRLGLPHAGCEELYAFHSIVDRGFRVAYVPEAVVTHPFPPPKIEDLRKRYLAGCEHSTGFIAFLFMEEKRYRGKLLKFVLEGMIGVRRNWRSVPEPTRFETGISTWQVLWAKLRGVWKFFRAPLPTEDQCKFHDEQPRS